MLWYNTDTINNNLKEDLIMENMENNVVEAVNEVQDLVNTVPEIKAKPKLNGGAIAIIAGGLGAAGLGIAAAWRHHKKVKAAKKRAAAEDDFIEDLDDEDDDYFDDDLDGEDQANSEEDSKEKTE
jgi:hypothetical protein